MKLLALATVYVVAVLFCPPSSHGQQPALLYVNRTDPTCGGRFPCFTKIQNAINAALPRTTIRIQSGTYSEQLQIQKNDFSGAVEADRIVIEADPNNQEQVVITGSPGSQCNDTFAVRIKSSRYVTIRGLTFTGTGGHSIFMMGGNNDNRDIHIELNRIVSNGSSNCSGGIVVAGGNPGTIIINNVIYGNGRNGITFDNIDGGPHYVINNTIYGNQWNGIDVGRLHHVLIANNIVNSNGTLSGTSGGRMGIRRESSAKPQPQSIQLRNNLICGNRGAEIDGPILDSSDSGNFTVLGREGAGVAAKPGCESAHNLFANAFGLDERPNTLDDDFQLRLGSFAVDIGMDPRTLGLNPVFDTIFEGDYFRDAFFRPQDGDGDGFAQFDAGAYEFAYDFTPPQVRFTSPDANVDVRGTVIVTAEINDSTSVANVIVAAGVQPLSATLTPPLPAPATTATTVWNTTTTGDGPVLLTVTATDTLGNTASATRSITVDNMPPETEISSGPSGQISQTSVVFTFTGMDNLTPAGSLLFAWRLDAGTLSPFSASTVATISGLAAGSHTFEVLARDRAGNEDPTPAGRTFTVKVGPAITDIDPLMAPIGAPVTITGSSFEPGITEILFNGAVAVAQSMTETTIVTTVPIDASTGSLRVTTPYGSASRDFTVTATQDFTLAISPSSMQTVQNGSPAVLIGASVTNGFSGVVELNTGPLPAGVSAVFAPSILVPNNISVLRLTTTTATPSGSHTVEIRASAQIDGRIVTKAGSVTLNVAASGQTVLVGQVLDGEDRPLPNVTIKLGGPTLTNLGFSDAAGNLFIPLTVTGPAVFLIDGSSASNPSTNYPTIPLTLDIQEGKINDLGYIPRLQGQPVAKLIPIVPGQATVITVPELPGFKMTIPAGVQIIGWDGQPNTQFGVTKVPIDRSPLPPILLPAGLEARETYLFSFGKMGGGTPTGNIPIDTPNNIGGLPGEKVDLYYFNEAPDGSAPNRWEKYGTGTISVDAATIVTDINPATGLQYGIPRFCCGALTVVFNFINRLFGRSGGPNDGGKKVGDPVDVSTGFFYVDKTDMVLAGRLPVVVTRTYRANFANAGPFGIGTSASFDISLQAPSVFSEQTIVLISPGNKQDVFSRQTNGTYINTTSPFLRGAVLTGVGLGSPVFVLRFKDRSSWRFNSAGMLISQSDRNGNMISYSRDSFNRVVTIQEPAGRTLTISYVGAAGAGNPNIQSITDPIGRQVHYTYDSSGRLDTVRDPAGGITRYTYDSAHRMLTLTDPRGITFLRNEYDSTDRIVRQTQADGGTWTFAYTASGSYVSQSVVTNPRGYATAYRFNAAGYPISETDAMGQTTTMERQPETNLVLSITDSLKRITRFEYDDAGNVSRITDPEGNTRSFSYNPTFGVLERITGTIGNSTRFEHDGSGNVTAIVNPLGKRTIFAYNTFGQPVSMTDPLGNMTTFIYDSRGNLTSVTDPLGSIMRRSYDPVSRLTSQTDPRGKLTQVNFDSMNRATSITDPGGGVTRFSYDENGNLVQFRDAIGNTIIHSYDSMDRLVFREDPLGAAETLQYDNLHNVTTRTDRRGLRTSFIYDALDRRTEAIYADGTSTSYVYDSAGRLQYAADSSGSRIVNLYDGLDRLTSQITDLGRINYQYDRLGRRTRTEIPGQPPITYDYDDASHITRILKGLQAVDFSYDPAGRRTQLALPNGVSTEYQYDAASRITALVYRGPNGILGDLTYQYDRAGNRTETGGSFTRSLLPRPAAQAIYDSANRQLEFRDRQMVFDANGNVTSATGPAGTSLFTWDTRNRLKAIKTPATSASFVYDPLGRRSEASVDGTKVLYQYDGLDVIHEYSDAAMTSSLLTGFGIDEHFIRHDSLANTKRYLLADVLGSSVALTDEAGAIRTEYTYDPFGKTHVTGEASLNQFQYTGRELDGTGLHYYRARYYDSESQRFLSEDPLGLAARDPNLYGYTGNNPVNLRDPTGQFVPVAAVGATLCATGAITGAYAHQQLSGRKATFGGVLGSAAAGCLGGLALGWGVGIALEAAVPSIMAGGGQVVLWSGLGLAKGSQLATAKAAELGAATIHQTFTGSAISLVEAAGISGFLTQPLWSAHSANFVAGARSAAVLIGNQLTHANVFMTKELPVLLHNKAVITFIFH